VRASQCRRACNNARARCVAAPSRRVALHQKELVGPSIVVNVAIWLGGIPTPPLPPHLLLPLLLLLLFREFCAVGNSFGLWLRLWLVLIVVVVVVLAAHCCWWCCWWWCCRRRRLQLHRHPTVPPLDDLADPCLEGSFRDSHVLVLPLVGRQQVERCGCWWCGWC